MAELQIPVPIILCGRREEICKPIIESLRPEIEVVHFVKTDEGAKSEIPLVLKGERPPSQSSHIGSGNFTNKPVAIVLGAGYGAEALQSLRGALDREGGQSAPILVADEAKQKDMPPLGPEYGKRMVGRVREAILKMRDEGKFGNGEGGVHLY